MLTVFKSWTFILIIMMYTYNFFRPSVGDGGVDLMGNFAGYLLLIQCKSSTTLNVKPEDIRGLEGVLSKYVKQTTIGIFINPLIIIYI